MTINEHGPRGRKRTRWIDSVWADMSQLGPKPKDVLDRQKWRAETGQADSVVTRA